MIDMSCEVITIIDSADISSHVSTIKKEERKGKKLMRILRIYP